MLRCLLLTVLVFTAAARPAEAQRPQRFPWDGRDHVNHVLVLVVDARSGALRHAYPVMAGTPGCPGSPVIADSVFLARTEAFLTGIGWPHQTTPAGLTPLGTEYVQANALGGDFAATAVFHREGGGLVLAYSSVWQSGGAHLWPAEPLDVRHVSVTDSLAPPPETVENPHGVPGPVLEAVRRLNVVHSLARQPYRATILVNQTAGPGAFEVVTNGVVLLSRRGVCPVPGT